MVSCNWFGLDRLWRCKFWKFCKVDSCSVIWLFFCVVSVDDAPICRLIVTVGIGFEMGSTLCVFLAPFEICTWSRWIVYSLTAIGKCFFTESLFLTLTILTRLFNLLFDWVFFSGVGMELYRCGMWSSVPGLLKVTSFVFFLASNSTRFRLLRLLFDMRIRCVFYMYCWRLRSISMSSVVICDGSSMGILGNSSQSRAFSLAGGSYTFSSCFFILGSI